MNLRVCARRWREVTQDVESALWDTGAADVRIAEDDAERERLWVGRKTAFGAFGTIAPNYYLVDGVVPRTQLTRMLRKVQEVSERYGIIIANVFHARRWQSASLYAFRCPRAGSDG